MRTSMARMRPVLSAPSFIQQRMSRPWPVDCMSSRRVAAQRTGRLSRLASMGTSVSSWYTGTLAPKPPPTRPVLRWICSGLSCRRSAIWSRMRWGVCVSPHMVSFCALSSQIALHARGSMHRGSTRWFIMSSSRMTSAAARPASTPAFSILSETARLEPVSG